ncbi:MAG: glycine--tRNA ligase beta subunit [Lysobacteraceae bacterium]|nr:MAG: glycine--tRNA ligase beta subunit [Xanthomonadaceae bacterium]
MSDRASLLVEIGTEELPPKALLSLSRALTDGLFAALRSADLVDDDASVESFETPRRLAVRISNVAERQADRKEQKLGPPVAAAFDADGKPKPAAIGFARSVGASDVSQLQRVETDKGQRLGFVQSIVGQSLASLLPAMISEVTAKLPVPKLMRWGNYEHRFVRPVHWVIAMHGDQAISGELFGRPFGASSQGHRFHHPEPIQIESADAYESALEQAFVIASTTKRREKIESQIAVIADDMGATAQLSDELLTEVACLVEWPVAISGSFDQAFLEVPEEALISSMEVHQRFFALRDAEGALRADFIGVANIESKDANEIRRGYERVIRPRLADAKFFFDVDLKTPLSDHLPALASMVYQKKLGTLKDKSQRVSRLCAELANDFGADADKAIRAAELGKCDLLTQMVGEFPELQGIMGAYYATAEGIDEQIALALREQYLPSFAGDAIATSGVGRCLAVAERLDSLCGIFAVGMKPSGTRDPYALRRAALGLIRTAIEGGDRFDLDQALSKAVGNISINGIDHAAIVSEVGDFIFERLRGYLSERGIDSEVFNSVLAVRPSELNDFVARSEAVAAFLRLPAADNLCAANKRITNILRKFDADVGNLSEDLLTEDAEKALAEALEAVSSSADALADQRNYEAALSALAGLGEPVDIFFDQVLVMADDVAVRANRMALLQRLQNLFLKVADVGQIAR